MRRMLCFLIAALQILSGVSVSSRLFAAHDGAHHQDGNHESSKAASTSEQGNGSMDEGVMYNGNEVTTRGLSRLGSRPPNCEYKCKGCNPCEATQIPATTDPIRVQYANYEPEGWKCKCGTAFFNP